jgi:hypothetical protein
MIGLLADDNAHATKEHGDINRTKSERAAVSSNTDKNVTEKKRKQSTIEEKIARQMKKEEKYAREQKFYQADQYDFKGAEVDPESLKKIKPIEPDYDFDITDVYRDDI